MKTVASTPPPSPGPARSDACAADAAAAQWVERRRHGLDVDGERELAAWLGASPLHAAALARLEAMADALRRARGSGAAAEIATLLKIRERKRRTRARALAAAGAVAAIMLAFGAWERAPREPQVSAPTQITSAAQPIRRLPDGSLVELKADAEIAVKFEPTSRRVELVRGEALFRVEKDASRPFIVRAGGIDVRAVGTAFSVRLSLAAVEVLVTEGQVGVDDPTRGRSLLPTAPAESPPVLVAGQSVLVELSPVTTDAPRSVRVAQIEPAEIKARLAWRIPRLEFDGIELARAVGQLNAANRQQITVEGDAVAQLRISGTFLADDPQTFSRLVAASLGLEAADRADGGIVLRKASSPPPR